MATHTFIVNGERVSVDADDQERLLWVLRDLLGITGPKYSCGLGACRACTSHINGDPFNPCIVPVSDIAEDDEITTIEGLAGTVGEDLHPVQQTWLDLDVAQCGYCQPGQIMAAVGLINEANADGRTITDADLDGMRNVCRCGTYPRIRNAIVEAQARMNAQPPTAPVENEVVAQASAPTAAARTTSLPATGIDSLLGPAALAAGTAVAIRVASDRGSSGAVPAEADAGEAERRDTDG